MARKYKPKPGAKVAFDINGVTVTGEFVNTADDGIVVADPTVDVDGVVTVICDGHARYVAAENVRAA